MASKEIAKIRKASRRIKLIGGEKNSKLSFELRREGKDLKNIFSKFSYGPSISINEKKTSTRKGTKISFLYENSFGLGQNLSAISIRSFEDFPDLDPVELIRQGGPYPAFPFVYNNKQNNERYRIKEEMSTDGVIEVFPIRRHLQMIDLDITGIKSVIGTGDFFTTANTTIGKKGSPLLDDKEEINKKSYDFFEDCQDVFFSEATFPSVGNINDTQRKFSNQGYSSNGKYILSPYKEEDVFIEQYDFMSVESRENFLATSRRNISELGTRFKTTGNGFIISQFEKNNNQKKIGTDSISFIGLTKG